MSFISTDIEDCEEEYNYKDDCDLIEKQDNLKGTKDVKIVHQILESDIDGKDNYMPDDSENESLTQFLSDTYIDPMISIRERIHELLNHPRNNNITFDPGNRSFFLKNTKSKSKTRLKGLLPFLSSVFWKDYEYIPNPHGHGTGVSSPLEGIERGLIVHKQIEAYVNSKTVKEYLETVGKKIDSYTKKAIIGLDKYGVQGIKAEFAIYDEVLGVATKIDTLAKYKDKLIIIEWKTGYDDSFMRAIGAMGGWFRERASDSPLNQARLQGLMACIILQKRYNIKIDAVHVFQINMEGVIPYDVPNEWYENADKIYANCIEYVESKRSQKRTKLNK